MATNKGAKHMVLMPQVDKYQELIEFGLVEQKRRSYIGMSGVGGRCERKIWMDWRWVHKASISKRVQRIFERGDWEEARVISDLESIGAIISDQQKEIVDETGHSRGHIDAIAGNLPDNREPHLLEIKTMNDSRYKAYLKTGLQITNPAYYVQINMYMGYLGLKHCLFVVANKNDESRDYTRIDFDQDCFAINKSKTFGITVTPVIPRKIGERTWIDCKFCDHKEYCHGKDTAEKNCRTCEYSEPRFGGIWYCSKHDEELSLVVQHAGCQEYEKMSCLS